MAVFQEDFGIPLGDLDSDMFAACAAFLDENELDTNLISVSQLKSQLPSTTPEEANEIEEPEIDFMGSFPHTQESTKQVDCGNPLPPQKNAAGGGREVDTAGTLSLVDRLDESRCRNGYQVTTSDAPNDIRRLKQASRYVELHSCEYNIQQQEF